MKILGIGSDIVDIRRLRQARFLWRIADFFFLEEEIVDMHGSRDAVEFAASRIAAKESIIKAYPGTLHYHDIVLKKKDRKLTARIALPEGSEYSVFVSIAHEVDHALGTALVSV